MLFVVLDTFKISLTLNSPISLNDEQIIIPLGFDAVESMIFSFL